MRPRTPASTLFPYTTLFRSAGLCLQLLAQLAGLRGEAVRAARLLGTCETMRVRLGAALHEYEQVQVGRSEEHTSELQSHSDLVCRLLLEKKKQKLDRKTQK